MGGGAHFGLLGAGCCWVEKYSWKMAGEIKFASRMQTCNIKYQQRPAGFMDGNLPCFAAISSTAALHVSPACTAHLNQHAILRGAVL